MSPLQVSAQFTAFVWFSNRNQGTAPRDEAVRFAKENWVPFLPYAHEGIGQLLIRVARLPVKGGQARPRQAAKAKKRPKRETAVAD